MKLRGAVFRGPLRGKVAAGGERPERWRRSLPGTDGRHPEGDWWLIRTAYWKAALPFLPLPCATLPGLQLQQQQQPAERHLQCDRHSKSGRIESLGQEDRCYPEEHSSEGCSGHLFPFPLSTPSHLIYFPICVCRYCRVSAPSSPARRKRPWTCWARCCASTRSNASRRRRAWRTRFSPRCTRRTTRATTWPLPHRPWRTAGHLPSHRCRWTPTSRRWASPKKTSGTMSASLLFCYFIIPIKKFPCLFQIMKECRSYRGERW